jgi:hypothetical protein
VHDLERYQALFVGATTERAIGEFSPTYLYWEGTAARIRSLVPEAKLIALLRCPPSGRSRTTS